MGFNSIACMLDCLTISVLLFDSFDEVDLASWSTAAFLFSRYATEFHSSELPNLVSDEF
jgi:hypothetical protein